MKKIKLLNKKDYLFVFILLMSSSFNFSYLYLINIIIGVIYIFSIQKLSRRAQKFKYLCEIFSIGYSSYALVFKLIVLMLIHNDNKYITKKYKNLFINLGICHLKDYAKNNEDNNKDFNSSYFVLMTFLSEIFVIIVSGYSIYISFKCRTLEEDDSKYNDIKILSLRETIILLYIFIVLLSLFNISFLSLLYILFIQLILLFSSIRITGRRFKYFYRFFVYYLIFLLLSQLLLTNILNIPSLKNYILNQNKVKVKEGNIEIIKIYSIFTQIGIKYSYEDTNKNIWLNFVSYFLGVFLLLTLYFIHISLQSGLNINFEKENEIEEDMNIIENNGQTIDKINLIVANNKNNEINIDNSDNNKNENDKKSKKKCVLLRLNIIYKLFSFMMAHPIFNYEIERIITIIWTYYYRNYYSLVMYIVLFCSFFCDKKTIIYLIIFILTPFLIITMGSYHISNIDGIIENLSDDKKVYFSKFAIGKYNNYYLEHIIGHIYYLTVIFLIYIFYSKKSVTKHQNNVKIKNKELFENLLLNNEYKNNGKENNGLLDEDLYENKSDESQSDEEDAEKYLIDEEKKESQIFRVIDEEKKIESFSLFILLIKFFFNHIDKMTLVIMYIISVYIINLTHVIFVFIFVFQIVIPNKIKYLYKIIIFFFQIVYLIEYIIDLIKFHHKILREYKKIINKYIIYSEDLKKCDIEIFLYGAIYCLYFQHIICNLKYIKTILEDDYITYENYLDYNFKNIPILKSIITFFIATIKHIFFWCLSFFFVFFLCYYELNILFVIKLILFFIYLYIFLLINNKKKIN